MPFDAIIKRSGMAQLEARRLASMQVIAASNRQPDGSQHIPLAQRQSIITVGRSCCRWPIGDPQHNSFYLCGARTDDGHSYCARHMLLAYVPASRSKRAA